MQDARRIYELMVLTAWADGKVQAEEALAVHRIVAADPAFAQVGNKSEISRAIQKRISEKGLDASLREAASAIAEADRELAFRLVATTDKAGAKEIKNYLNSGTFLKRGGKWQVVNWQATVMPKPEAKAP